MIFLVSFAKVLQWENNYKTANLGGSPSVINCWFSHHNYKGTSMEQTTQKDSSATGLSSFETGVLMALVALKAAIAATPHFNAEALEKAATYFLENPPALANKDHYEWPLNMLRASQEGMLPLFNQAPTPPA